MAVELSIKTRAITSDTYAYEVGSTWENYVDIENGDYKVYFFTNDKDDATATSDAERNTLITEFQPKDMTAVEGINYTQYTLTGDVDKVIAEYPYFKVVVLANWGAYPDVTAGETTIDALVEGDNSTFTAETFFNGVDADHLIPFYGVREYSDVKWRKGIRTPLSGDITLLRAIAKVEVVVTEDSEIDSFDSVSIAGYNSTGYCAPKGVYLRSDYDHDTYPDIVYPYIIYVPENIQGENGSSNDKANNVPSTLALNAEASLNVTLQDGTVIGPYTYTAYPGGNSDTNFNVRRNCVYRVKLTITYPVTLDAVPSANCIVCLSGQTTTFFPYCREETGGGYNFTDYLDAYDETGAKNIDHIGIVWQSKTETSSSGRLGFLGNNSDNSLVWIDAPEEVEAEYLRKIHVAVPEGERGNALVAAYNSDDEIIWSWHIWARTPDADPTSVGTQLYYTYYWDDNGIYGKDSGRARIAGYTIMNCNLGAMQDEPTNGDVSGRSTVAPTYGLMYEWGRKDPFPPYNRIGGNSNGVFVNYADYVLYNGNYYCDGEDNEIAFANYAQTEANELFYSLPGNSRPTTFDEAIRQSIQNPTAYLCGSNEAKAYDGPQLGVSTYNYSLSNSARLDSLATNFPEPHDGNWLYDEESEHYNRLWGGLDPEQDAVSKSFDTGYTSTLGDIHLYDDYGEKSIFDPCPYGWRVSPPVLWLGFTDNGLNPNNLTNVNYCEDKSDLYGMYMYMTGWREGNMSFFPTQGTRQANGAAYKIGNCGNYHNATADSGGRVNIMHIHDSDVSFKIFENTSTAYYLKSVASAVRCVRTATVVQQ